MCSRERGVEELEIELSARFCAKLIRYPIDQGLLCYSTDVEDTARHVLPHDRQLKYRIRYETHDIAINGHLGRENTYSSVSKCCWWLKLYKWVYTYVRTGNVVFVDQMSMMLTWRLCSIPIMLKVQLRCFSVDCFANTVCLWQLSPI